MVNVNRTKMTVELYYQLKGKDDLILTMAQLEEEIQSRINSTPSLFD